MYFASVFVLEKMGYWKRQDSVTFSLLDLLLYLILSLCNWRNQLMVIMEEGMVTGLIT